MTAVPIINLPNLYVNGLQAEYASTTSISVAAGQCRDSTDSYDMVLEDEVTILCANNGANGLDTGDLAANTWYYIYLISDPVTLNPTAAIASLSATNPLMPFGYSAFRLIMAANTNGSSQFDIFFTSGSGNKKSVFYDAAQSVLSGGTAATLTNVNLSSGVPPIANTTTRLQVAFTPNAAGSSVMLATAGSSTTTGAFFNGSTASVVARGQLEVVANLVSGNATIQYINSAAACSTTLGVIGFDLYV